MAGKKLVKRWYVYVSFVYFCVVLVICIHPFFCIFIQMICCPRRFGKTFATGMFVAAYLYVIPSVEICIFSPSRRQSVKMLELVRTFLIKLPGAKERITKYNKEYTESEYI